MSLAKHSILPIIKICYLNLVLALLTIVAGCSSLTPLVEDKAESLDVLILTSNNINPNPQGRPSPLKIDFYQLAEDSVFISSEYSKNENQLTIEEEQYLSRDVAIISPDSLEEVSFELLPETKYLGIVGGFMDIDNSEWRNIYQRQDGSGIFQPSRKMYLTISGTVIQQVNESEMKEILKIYHRENPDDARVSKFGGFDNSGNLEPSKGIFVDISDISDQPPKPSPAKDIYFSVP